MKRLITQSQLRKILGLNVRDISDLVKAEMQDAVVNGKLDRDHPTVKAYIERAEFGQIEIPEPPPTFKEYQEGNVKPQTDPNGLPTTDYLAGTEIEELGDMTLREIANRYGTVAQLIDWLNARKKIVDISEKEIKNAKLRNDLIPRTYVEKFIVQAFERTFMNLLNDAPKSVASEILSIFKSGGFLEDAEIVAEKVISSHIQSGKETVARLIENA